VDPITSGWLTRGVLVNFYQANLRALERGVAITRIFVTSREELAEPDIQKVLFGQYNDGIEVRIAFRDELPSASVISGRIPTVPSILPFTTTSRPPRCFPIQDIFRPQDQPGGGYRALSAADDLIEHSSMPLFWTRVR